MCSVVTSEKNVTRVTKSPQLTRIPLFPIRTNKGWIDETDFGGPEGVSIVFDWQSEPKSYGSMFVGTVPELDLAVYTICFLAR